MKEELHNAENHPLVSIVIGNYNYDRFLNQAIDSVLNQTYENIEVIVVDDGSKDNSREIIFSYGNKIIPIFKENGGLSSCHNAGFASSRGDIICFLDSDDIFTPSKVADIVKIFESYEEIAWCFHSLQLIDIKGDFIDTIATPRYISRECDFQDRIKAGKIPPHIPPTSALCFRRSLLNKILPIPTSQKVLANDYYVKFMAVALAKGFMLGEDLTNQRIHGSNALTLREDKLHLKARDYLFTGKWIRQEFPQFKKFANKLVSVATAMNWVSGNHDIENIQGSKSYLSSSSTLDQINIYSVALYYYLSSLKK